MKAGLRGSEGQTATAEPHAGWLGPLAVTAVFLLGLLFMVQLMDCRFIPGDEGVATMGAWRITQGQVPHRDFFEIVPPFSFLPTALAFKLLGSNFFSERLLVVLYGMLLMVGTERLLALFTRDALVRSLVAAFLIPFGVFSWSIPSHHWVVNILQIFAMLVLITGMRGDRPVLRGAIAGVLSALACFSLQDQGAYFVVALMVLVFPWIEDRKVRRFLFSSWALSGLAVAGIFAAWLLPHVSLNELIYQWIQFPTSRYKELAGNLGSVASILSGIGSRQWLEQVRAAPAFHIGLTGLSGLLILLPPVALMVMAWGAIRSWRPRPEIGLLAAGCVAFLGACLHRYALLNLIWAAAAPLVPVAWGLGRLRRSSVRWYRHLASVAAALVIVCAFSYSGAIVSMTKGPAMVEIRGTAGELRTLASSREASLGPVIRAVEEHVPSGSPLFCTGFNGLVNFWTQRPNPTRYNFLEPGYHTRAQAEEVVRYLEGMPDAFVLLFFPPRAGDLVADYALRDYRRVWQGSTAMLLAPRDADDRP